ncbi:MAG: hypothetical protein K6G89_02105 [Clostridia bacterium]|nr:hypothetical protein [Clostridia bacterium]
MNGGDFVFLCEKEEIWARMLMEALKDNGIECGGVPVYGAGLAMKTGMADWVRVFVPEEKLAEANGIVSQLFEGENFDGEDPEDESEAGKGED